eukprot:3782089-Rhodomonas_salina.3
MCPPSSFTSSRQTMSPSARHHPSALSAYGSNSQFSRVTAACTVDFLWQDLILESPVISGIPLVTCTSRSTLHGRGG